MLWKLVATTTTLAAGLRKWNQKVLRLLLDWFQEIVLTYVCKFCAKIILLCCYFKIQILKCLFLNPLPPINAYIFLKLANTSIIRVKTNFPRHHSKFFPEANMINNLFIWEICKSRGTLLVKNNYHIITITTFIKWFRILFWKPGKGWFFHFLVSKWNKKENWMLALQ